MSSEVENASAPGSLAAEPAAATTTAPVSLWHNADFLKFWFGETVSLLGTQVTVLALPLIAVYAFDAGPEELGLLRFLQLVPYLAFGLLFGVWVDRVRRRSAMLGANLARMLLVGSVPLLTVLGDLRLEVLLVVAFGIGVASVLFDVSWASYLPTLVTEPQRLVEANSKLSGTSTAAETVGPGAAGFLVSVFTAPIVMAIDALSYLASLISLLLTKTREPPPETPAVRRRLVPELREGLRWVFGNRLLRAVAVVGCFCNFILMANTTLFMLYAVRDRGLGPATLGLIWSLGSVGGFLGALLSHQLVRRMGLGRVYSVFTSMVFVPLLLIPAAGGPPPLVVGMFVAAFFLSYLGLAVSNVVVLSLRQVITPRPLLGRMSGAMRMLLFGGGALGGGPVAAWLGATFGLRPALFAIAVTAALMVVPVLLSPVARLETMPSAAGADHVSDATGRDDGNADQS